MGRSPVVVKRKTDPVRLTFPQALNYVIDGKKITKQSWENEEFYILLKDEILMLHKDDDKFYQLIVSEGDLIGIDWVVLEGAK